MKTIITLIAVSAILTLSGCSSEYIRTGQLPLETPLIYQQPSLPKVNLTLPATTGKKSRHHSILEIGKRFIPDEIQTESNKNESLFPSISSYLRKGIASWYGPGFHGKKTANGEIFNMYELTAAHKTLPIPSYAQVTNLRNQKTVVVRINDRGPYCGKRLVDLSYAAAKKIGIRGTGNVEIKAISSLEALPHMQKHAENQHKDIFLQVGSFGSHIKAVRLQDKLASNNLPEPTIQTSTNKRKIHYKVQMGPIKSRQSAELLSYQLAKMGIKDSEIIIASREY